MVESPLNLLTSRKFQKHFAQRIKSHSQLARRTDTRLLQFLQNPQNPILKDHALKGSKIGLRSFSITGDLRIIYEVRSNHSIMFLDIGTHNQVYQ